MHILEEKILTARKEGRIALIPFVTAGFPAPDRFWETVMELDQSGADIIEIGVPFSDPVADGPVVEAASVQALQDGVTLRGILSDLKKYAGAMQAGLVLMGYFNPFLRYGLENFASEAAEAGVKGCIVPDLPYDEAAEFRTILKQHGIALIPLVGPNTDDARMKLYADVSEGYVYVVSVMGTTGERDALPREVPEVISRSRKNFSLPVALGFGLKTPEQLNALSSETRPDAAVFGSSLLTHIASGKTPKSFMQLWTQQN
ncbi:MAG: tryptophan synthase subunit alpha [Desulfovibrionaceae bacterium]|nr:tryptophan synthase subunit alpha [Desulfovibrionaceae bacterium]